MNKAMLAPSMMCADFLHLEEQLRLFEREGIDLLHVDIMDGHFVPNITLGTDFVRMLKKATSIPLDIHLMVERPENLLPAIAFGEGDYVSVHYESTVHLQRVLAAIRERGAKPLLALNPGTPVSMAEEVLGDIDGLLVMTVNPGFAGQKLVPSALEKIARARLYLDAYGMNESVIEVDGNVSIPNGIAMRAAGADIFVAGTSGVFIGDDMAGNIRHFRRQVFGE
ncbi:MAG: ribulose-phosphate 3-epimerase [Ruminococcaceae bacterium]|nr:ribulose-phosphate 3-epimerase [Oscillospiraceae bacterium]